MASWCNSPKVTLYEKQCFTGRCLQVFGDVPNLGGFDNSVSSAIVHEGDWGLYSEIKYSGKRIIISEGQSYPSLPGLNNAASSIAKL